MEIRKCRFWHDDLGLQEDSYEMLVKVQFAVGPGSVLAKVSRCDVAVAAKDEFAWELYAEFFHTIRMLLLAGV